MLRSLIEPLQRSGYIPCTQWEIKQTVSLWLFGIYGFLNTINFVFICHYTKQVYRWPGYDSSDIIIILMFKNTLY